MCFEACLPCFAVGRDRSWRVRHHRRHLHRYCLRRHLRHVHLAPCSSHHLPRRRLLCARAGRAGAGATIIGQVSPGMHKHPHQAVCEVMHSPSGRMRARLASRLESDLKASLRRRHRRLRHHPRIAAYALIAASVVSLTAGATRHVGPADSAVTN